jgi:hypothetical protein
VRAADGIGVLARITDAIAGRRVRVEQAYVSTLDHLVADLEDALLVALRPAAGGTSGSSHVDDQLR